MTSKTKFIFSPLLISFLACVAGCDSRTPVQHADDTDKVLQELGAIPKPIAPKPAMPKLDELATSGASADNESLESNEASSEPQTPVPKPTFTFDDQITLSEPWINADLLPREIWEVQYVGNNPVGYLRRKSDVSLAQGNKVFRIEAESRLRVSLNGKALDQRLKVSTLESDSGELINMEGLLEIGESKQSFEGRVVKGLLVLTVNKDGQSTSTSLDWRQDYRGPFAVDQSMIRRPLKPNETRKLQYFDPILAKIVDGKLEAEKYSMKTTTMFGGSRELLEVRNTGTVGDSTMQAIMWVDEKGEGYKSYMASGDIRSFRTEPLAAQIISSISDLRAIAKKATALSGDVDQLLKNKPDVYSQTYQIAHKSKDPFKLFPNRVNQRIKSLNTNTAELTVFRIVAKPEVIGGIADEPESDPDTLSESEFVPSKNPQIQKIASLLIASSPKQATGNAVMFETMNSCRTGLFKRVEIREFDNQIGNITDVLRNKKADCVEHALLLASVCRAKNIPARIALGMIFNRSLDNPEMTFHAWVEFRDGKRWIPIDSSDSQFPTSIDRIKVMESNFTEANPYVKMVETCRLLPELQIRVMPP